MKKQPTKISEIPDILTLAEACAILHCHPNTLRNWDNRGILKAIRFGTRGDRRYHKGDILAVINANR